MTVSNPLLSGPDGDGSTGNFYSLEGRKGGTKFILTKELPYIITLLFVVNPIRSEVE